MWKRLKLENLSMLKSLKRILKKMGIFVPNVEIISQMDVPAHHAVGADRIDKLSTSQTKCNVCGLESVGGVSTLAVPWIETYYCQTHFPRKFQNIY